MGKTVHVQQVYKFSSSQLHLSEDEVHRLARALNSMSGIVATATSQGRGIIISIEAKSARAFKAIDEKMLGVVRHAVERSALAQAAHLNSKEDQAVMAFLRS